VCLCVYVRVIIQVAQGAAGGGVLYRGPEGQVFLLRPHMTAAAPAMATQAALEQQQQQQPGQT